MNWKKYAVFVGIGLVAQVLIAAFYRILYTSFPLDLLGALLICIPFFGLALGAFLTRRLGSPSFPLEALLVAGVVLFVGGAIANLNVMVHYLLMKLYYPFPRPRYYTFRMIALGTGILLSFLPLTILGARFARALDRAQNAPRAFTAYVLGSLAGWGLGFGGNITLGPYRLLALSGAALLFLCLPRKPLAVIGTLLIGLCLWLVETQDEVFFLWRLKGYERLETRWTPYYKLDFLKFEGDPCVGMIYNNLLMSYACEDPTLFPLEVRQIVGAASAGRRRILAAGRLDGMYVNSIRKEHGLPERVLSLEFDPVLKNALTGRYANFTEHVFEQPGSEARWGDLRRILESTTEKFDLAFLNGQMIRIYPMPYTLIPQEDYLFTINAFRTIFDRVLEPDGVLVVDWGSTKGQEVYDYVTNLPKGVHARAVWTTLSSYPLVSTPLFFLFASHSEAALDSILWDLEGRGGFKEVELDPKELGRADTDSRPFLQAGLMPIILMSSLVPAAILGVFTGWMWKRMRRAAPASTGLATRSLLAGLAMGTAWAFAVGRFCRAFDSGPPFGSLCVGIAFLGGYAAATGWLPRRAHARAHQFAGPIAALGIGLGFTAQEAVAATAGSAFLGLGVGLLWIGCLGENHGRDRLWGFERLGAVWGILLVQWSVWALGYIGTAGLVVLVAIWPLLADLRSRRRPRNVPAAEPAG